MVLQEWGYFTASKPDDQFIISSELEEEVKGIMKQHQQDQEKSRPRASDLQTTTVCRSEGVAAFCRHLLSLILTLIHSS